MAQRSATSTMPSPIKTSRRTAGSRTQPSISAHIDAGATLLTTVSSLELGARPGHRALDDFVVPLWRRPRLSGSFMFGL